MTSQEMKRVVDLVHGHWCDITYTKRTKGADEILTRSGHVSVYIGADDVHMDCPNTDGNGGG